MRLDNSFTVSFPPEQAWGVLTDLERVAPCMPGVRLDAVDGGDFRGGLRVKVGPISAEYSGSARFLDRDADSLVAAWQAEGRELRGRGTASATVTMKLARVPEGTRVDVATDLVISGRLAQFGRGMLGEVAARLLAEFVRALEREVADPRRPAAAVADERPAPASAPIGERPTVVTDLASEPWPDDETGAEPSAVPAAAPVETSVERPSERGETSADAVVLRAVVIAVTKRAAPVVLALAVSILVIRRLRRCQNWSR